MSRAGIVELEAMLREVIGERLSSSGWHADETRGIRFERPFENELIASFELVRSHSIPDRAPLRLSALIGGVEYAPLRLLWPLLSDMRAPFAAAEVISQGHEAPLAVIGRAEDVASAALLVGDLVHDKVDPFIASFDDVDSLITRLKADDDQEPNEVRLLPALLAAARRFDEASEALARFSADDEDDWRSRRFVRQLTRWIDSDGDPSLLPPEGETRRPPRPSASASWAEGQSRRAANKAAQQAVSRTTSRDEAHEILERELAKRGVQASQLSIDRTVDHLVASPAERAKMTLNAARSLGGLGLAGIRAFRRRELPDPWEPEWLQPPDEAAYEVYADPRTPWVPVELDQAALDWLRRAWEAAPHIIDAATVTVWLQPSPEAGGGPSVLLGATPVGRISQGDSPAYDGVLRAAQHRDELPRLHARLTRRPSPFDFVLEIPLPASR